MLQPAWNSATARAAALEERWQEAGLPDFRDPARSPEAVWRAGRAACEDAACRAALQPVRTAVLDSLLLADPLAVNPRFSKPPPTTEQQQAGSSPREQRRATGGSRPGSGRSPRRPSSTGARPSRPASGTGAAAPGWISHRSDDRIVSGAGPVRPSAAEKASAAGPGLHSGTGVSIGPGAQQGAGSSDLEAATRSASTILSVTQESATSPRHPSRLGSPGTGSRRPVSGLVA
jgi:hypothetical protein